METLILKPVKMLINVKTKNNIKDKVETRLQAIDRIIQEIKDIKICKQNI